MERLQIYTISTLFRSAFALEIRIFASIFAAIVTFFINLFCFILGLEMYGEEA